jgi:hypothetical protein
VNVTRSEDQDQAPAPIVPVLATAAVTFGAVPGSATIGVPAALLPGPANGVRVGPSCPDCGGDDGAA